MVDGGDNIVEATWKSVSGIMEMVSIILITIYIHINNKDLNY